MTEKNQAEDQPTSPLTSVDWLKKHSYAIIIVLLIGLLAFMIYPDNTIYILLGLAIPILAGIGAEMIFQTNYYKCLNYQLSRLEKTIIVSAAVGTTGLAMGYFSEPITKYLGSMMVSSPKSDDTDDDDDEYYDDEN